MIEQVLSELFPMDFEKFQLLAVFVYFLHRGLQGGGGVFYKHLLLSVKILFTLDFNHDIFIEIYMSACIGLNFSS